MYVEDFFFSYTVFILNCIIVCIVCFPVVENMRAALQKLETRVSVLEKSPVPAASPCVTVADLLDVYGHFKKHN